ncbi:MAG: hypothetical protein WDZ62_01990 [Candidatus Pacearchaeota archaeon]
MNPENYTKKITDYLKKNLKKGYTVESLKWALIGQGYPKTTVERAIRELNKDLAKKAPVLKEKPVIKYEVLDENNQPVKIKKSWWKKFFSK